MQRIVLTPAEQSAIDAFKTSYEHFDPDGLIYAGSNLVVDDHLQVDNSWEGVVLGGENGSVWFFIPAWGGLIIPIDLVDYVTDRAGPNGEEMPIFDEQQLQARSARGGAQNPREAARAERAHRRDVKELVRDALKRLPKPLRKEARQKLRAAGVLGPDDKDDDA